MSEVAATAAPAAPTTGAPSSAVIHERLKTFLSPSTEPTPDSQRAEGGVARIDSKAASPPQGEKAASDGAPVPETVPAQEAAVDDRDGASADVQSDDAQSDEGQFSDLSEIFSAAFGESPEKGFDLPVKVKVDGKESTVPLRDLVKSYQLDSHINQKAESLNTDRKAFEAKRQSFESERADKLLKMDAGLKTLERQLYGQFASVDWNRLASENPAEYQAQRVALQDHQAVLQDIGRAIAEEQGTFQTQQKAQYEAHLAEQRKLLDARLPEWASETVRTKDKAEMAAYLAAKGAPEGVFDRFTDAWQVEALHDALKWARLQKTKPGAMNKVKAAPRILKPGSPQSRAARESVVATKDRDQLRATGRVRDAAPLLKRFM